MKKQLLLTLTLLIATALSACGPQPAAQTPLEPATATETVVQPTQSPAATETSIAVLPTVSAVAATSNTASFKNDIIPIFETSCIKCHGGERTKEGLDLKTYESLMAGSLNGSVLEAGNADNSLLVQQIVEGEMPKRENSLPDSDIQTIINWVNAGALNN